MRMALIVCALAALVQTALLLMAWSEVRYWRNGYQDVSDQRDRAIAGWKKTADDYNTAMGEAKAFRERVEQHLGMSP